MKLDRNINRGGRGKYALVNMRKVIPLIEAHESTTETSPSDGEIEDLAAFNRLVNCGIITLGNETPGDQFFVMKYKDKFTQHGLRAYASGVRAEAVNYQDQELKEFAEQMFREADLAQELGNRIPD